MYVSNFADREDWDISFNVFRLAFNYIYIYEIYETANLGFWLYNVALYARPCLADHYHYAPTTVNHHRLI